MKEILDQYRVLTLNKFWQPVSACTVRRAIKLMVKEPRPRSHREVLGLDKSFDEDEEGPPCRALHIELQPFEDENANTRVASTILPVKWAEWITLPIRENDLFVRSAHSRIRVPTVIIAEDYEEIPLKTPQYSSYEIAKRDNFIDQYTGKHVPRENGNIDHVICRDRGGTTSWENCVWTSKEINELKANLSLEEFTRKYGYKLIRQPKKPGPRLNIINRYNIPEWDIFLKGKK